MREKGATPAAASNAEAAAAVPAAAAAPGTTPSAEMPPPVDMNADKGNLADFDRENRLRKEFQNSPEMRSAFKKAPVEPADVADSVPLPTSREKLEREVITQRGNIGLRTMANNPGLVDKFNDVQSAAGSGIKGSVVTGADGKPQMMFSGRGEDAQATYTDTEGKPTKDWTKTAQYAEGVARATADRKSLRQAAVNRAAMGDRDLAIQLSTGDPTARQAVLNEMETQDLRNAAKYGNSEQRRLAAWQLVNKEQQATTLAKDAATRNKEAFNNNMELAKFNLDVAKTQNEMENRAFTQKHSIATFSAQEQERTRQAADKRAERLDTVIKSMVPPEIADPKDPTKKIINPEHTIFNQRIAQHGSNFFLGPDGKELSDAALRAKVADEVTASKLISRLNSAQADIGRKGQVGTDIPIPVNVRAPTLEESRILGIGGKQGAAIAGMDVLKSKLPWADKLDRYVMQDQNGNVVPLYKLLLDNNGNLDSNAIKMLDDMYYKRTKKKLSDLP